MYAYYYTNNSHKSAQSNIIPAQNIMLKEAKQQKGANFLHKKSF
jgi:hypothetical protein